MKSTRPDVVGLKQYIHDGVAQEITVVLLKIDMVKHYLEKGLRKKAVAELNTCQTTLRKSVEKLQKAVDKLGDFSVLSPDERE